MTLWCLLKDRHVVMVELSSTLERRKRRTLAGVSTDRGSIVAAWVMGQAILGWPWVTFFAQEEVWTTRGPTTRYRELCHGLTLLIVLL